MMIQFVKMEMPMKILIAEDDLSVCEMLRLFLHKEEYTAAFAHNGLIAQKLFQNEHWDLVILDWMLPGKDGITLCREFRQAKDTPIILLTAKDGEHDRIMGLELGADDYVTKPFSPMELMARIKAVLRRYKSSAANDPSGGGQPASEASECYIRHQNLTIDLNSRMVMIDGRSIYNLTPKEFELLCLFAKHPKRVFTREQLLESIWGFDYFGEERTVDVHIKRLRNKICTPEQQFVVTVWGTSWRNDS
jgi:two-component system OmpR family response regulator